MGGNNKFNLDEYEPVEERIRRFYADHADGRIYTDMMNPADKPETAIFKASVYIGDVHVSDGWALEKDGEGYVNKTSHLENCETSAIGRALANFNYQGSKRPSREEMSKVVNEPKPKPEPKPLTVAEQITALMLSGAFSENEKAFYRAEVVGKNVKELEKILAEARAAAKAKEKPVLTPKEEAGLVF